MFWRVLAYFLSCDFRALVTMAVVIGELYYVYGIDGLVEMAALDPLYNFVAPVEARRASL